MPDPTQPGVKPHEHLVLNSKHIYHDQYRNARIKSVTLEEGVTSIGERAFHNCVYLTSVSFPSSLETIHCAAFSHCIRLLKVELKDNVKTVGSKAFSKCVQLQCATFSPAVNFGTDVFHLCPTTFNATTACASTSIKLSESKLKALQHVPHKAFYGAEMQTLVLEEGLKSIGEEAFRNCLDLRSVVFPMSLTTIHCNAFRGCKSLTNVKLGKNVAVLGNTAFAECDVLAEAVLLPTPVVIGADVFCACSKSFQVRFAEGHPVEDYKVMAKSLNLEGYTRVAVVNSDTSEKVEEYKWNPSGTEPTITVLQK